MPPEPEQNPADLHCGTEQSHHSRRIPWSEACLRRRAPKTLNRHLFAACLHTRIHTLHATSEERRRRRDCVCSSESPKYLGTAGCHKMAWAAWRCRGVLVACAEAPCGARGVLVACAEVAWRSRGVRAWRARGFPCLHQRHVFRRLVCQAVYQPAEVIGMLSRLKTGRLVCSAV